MKGEMKIDRNGISCRNENFSVYMKFRFGQNEIIFIAGVAVVVSARG